VSCVIRGGLLGVRGTANKWGVGSGRCHCFRRYGGGTVSGCDIKDFSYLIIEKKKMCSTTVN
jgi:hypothetical protein